MKFILIVAIPFYFYGAGSGLSAEFNSESACESAKRNLEVELVGFSYMDDIAEVRKGTVIKCLPKG
jgi:hypothetical protein